MIKGESKTGFKFNINEKFIDWELLSIRTHPSLVLQWSFKLL